MFVAMREPSHKHCFSQFFGESPSSGDKAQAKVECSGVFVYHGVVVTEGGRLPQLRSCLQRFYCLTFIFCFFRFTRFSDFLIFLFFCFVDFFVFPIFFDFWDTHDV